jgi:hypothetical protein
VPRAILVAAEIARDAMDDLTTLLNLEEFEAAAMRRASSPATSSPEPVRTAS